MMDQQESILMMKAMSESLKKFPIHSPEDVSMGQQEKMLTRIVALTGQGALFSYFASIQTMLLILKWTKEIDWSWWFIPIPTIMLAAIWYAISWSQKKQAERLINHMKRDIDELKRHIQEDIPT